MNSEKNKEENSIQFLLHVMLSLCEKLLNIYEDYILYYIILYKIIYYIWRLLMWIWKLIHDLDFSEIIIEEVIILM